MRQCRFDLCAFFVPLVDKLVRLRFDRAGWCSAVEESIRELLGLIGDHPGESVHAGAARGIKAKQGHGCLLPAPSPSLVVRIIL